MYAGNPASYAAVYEFTLQGPLQADKILPQHKIPLLRDLQEVIHSSFCLLSFSSLYSYICLHWESWQDFKLMVYQDL